MRRYASVTFSDVTITGPFWSESLDCVLNRTIPSQYDQLQRHGLLDSLKLTQPAPPLRIPRNRHNFTTQIFWDSDIGKWIEAAAYAISHRRDPDIEAKIEAIITDLEQAQAPDGYLNCWYLGREPQNRWTNLRDNHELYNAGHMLEGAVAYYHATGRDRFMQVMMRYMDHVAATFGPGPGQKRGYCGHQEIELALVKLFQATGQTRFLDLARYFINERGAQPHYFDQERAARGEEVGTFVQGTYEYSQSHLPVRQQTKVVGHAVRAMYMYTAMADLAAEDGDASLQSACEVLWQDVTATRMYVTGGFGPSASNEGFTRDYDLPNDTAYAETCASVAFVFWAARMLNLDLDGRYGDLLEQALFNTALAGLSRDGTQYFYDNKLDSDGSHQRWDWHPCPCCTMNVSRLVASIAGYFYGLAEDEVAVHLYGGAQTVLPVAGGSLTRGVRLPLVGRHRPDAGPRRLRPLHPVAAHPRLGAGGQCGGERAGRADGNDARLPQDHAGLGQGRPRDPVAADAARTPARPSRCARRHRPRGPAARPLGLLRRSARHRRHTAPPAAPAGRGRTYRAMDAGSSGRRGHPSGQSPTHRPHRLGARPLPQRRPGRSALHPPRRALLYLVQPRPQPDAGLAARIGEVSAAPKPKSRAFPVCDVSRRCQAPAAVNRSMSRPVSVSSAARAKLPICATVVALAIGAVTPGRPMTQASATSARSTSCRSAT
jgi:uncharacterized protein